MATTNPFELLDDDAEDPSQLMIVIQQQKVELKKPTPPSAKQPPPLNKVPPPQAVREARTEPARGGGRGYVHGRGAGGGSYREFTNSETSYGNREISAGQGPSDTLDAEKFSESRGGPRGPRGGRRSGFSNGEAGGEGDRDQDRLRRPFERRSGTGRGYEMKREGAGRSNWGTQTDELTLVTEDVVNEGEKGLNTEKPVGEEESAVQGDKEAAATEVEEKEKEDKEMTLEEYEKVLEEKRKALLAPKTEERKVDVKEFESMQPLANKKTNDEIFVKLGSEKDKKKELAEKEERARKCVSLWTIESASLWTIKSASLWTIESASLWTIKSASLNEFLKPAEGERYYGGRGRGRGRGSRGGYNGGGSERSNFKAPSIEDPGHFPALGGGK